MLDQPTIEAIARGYHQAEKSRQRVRPPTWRASAAIRGWRKSCADRDSRPALPLRYAQGQGHPLPLTRERGLTPPSPAGREKVPEGRMRGDNSSLCED